MPNPILSPIIPIIDGYRNKILTTPSLEIGEASQYLVELSALLANLGEEILFAQQAYSRRVVEILKEEKMTVSKATIIAETLPEYVALERAKLYHETTIEMIRACKWRCKSLALESDASRNL